MSNKLVPVTDFYFWRGYRYGCAGKTLANLEQSDWHDPENTRHLLAGWWKAQDKIRGNRDNSAKRKALPPEQERIRKWAEDGYNLDGSIVRVIDDSA